ncbi:MAG: hypothetical protein JW749_10475 [Sedimentisphaerales bacterium]|nr:hypothetical protein [Sedimentisphaerales bacterium]
MKLNLLVITVMTIVLATAQAGYAQCEEPVIEQLTSGDVDKDNVRISGVHAVWQGEDPNGGDWEIYYYDGSTVTQLTDNNTADIEPDIKGSNVVWQGRDANEGDWEIFYSNGQCFLQITDNNQDDGNPQVSASRIFWKGWVGVNWEVFSAAFPVGVSMKVSPRTINLKSKGQSITATLLLGDDLKADDVVVSSLRLLGQVPASKVKISARSNKLIAKFDRPEVQTLLQTGNDVEITLTGKMQDGTFITATDTVKVIKPGN